MRRVVVTGSGVVSALGHGVAEAFARLPFKHSEGLKLFSGADMQRKTEMQREWTIFYKQNYTEAKKLAEAGK